MRTDLISILVFIIAVGSVVTSLQIFLCNAAGILKDA